MRREKKSDRLRTLRLFGWLKTWTNQNVSQSFGEKDRVLILDSGSKPAAASTFYELVLGTGAFFLSILFNRSIINAFVAADSLMLACNSAVSRAISAITLASSVSRTDFASCASFRRTTSFLLSFSWRASLCLSFHAPCSRSFSCSRLCFAPIDLCSDLIYT